MAAYGQRRSPPPPAAPYLIRMGQEAVIRGIYQSISFAMYWGKHDFELAEPAHWHCPIGEASLARRIMVNDLSNITEDHNDHGDLRRDQTKAHGAPLAAGAEEPEYALPRGHQAARCEWQVPRAVPRRLSRVLLRLVPAGGRRFEAYIDDVKRICARLGFGRTSMERISIRPLGNRGKRRGVVALHVLTGRIA
ncbi:hypothetical protein N657DRAFT_314824 [Parathielavia appendiculata]|uniref:Uncharacterized protein n=1 Tax=Parathielavia appendiculata TaxID=2587402 RepID=A0AAN6U5P7_9PEZI|nr:hypothetical protein N657DRAFT_314824 [Parathielavia appendiculata]